MEILELRLQTAALAAQRMFYAEVLGLPVLEETATSSAFQAGSTRLVFEQTSEGEPRYHIAFNISRDKMARAQEWLATRASLLERDGQAVFDFRSWDALSVYFFDPAGNVVEFIARQAVPKTTAGPFGPADLLNVSEIGLPVDDVPARAADLIAMLGIEPYKDQSETFAPLGDEHGLLIVVKIGRAWFPTETTSIAAPLRLTVLGRRPERHHVPGLPYDIDIAARGGQLNPISCSP
jgi:catechol-2,3-dioxygenase